MSFCNRRVGLKNPVACLLGNHNPSVRCHLGFWAAAPKGTKSCRTQGESVCPSIRPSIHTYVHRSVPPLPPHPQGFVSFGTYSDPNSAKSVQAIGIGGHYMGLRGHFPSQLKSHYSSRARVSLTFGLLFNLPPKHMVSVTCS